MTTLLSNPVTRVATFKFHPHVTPVQKADRTRAFLNLYAEHRNLILAMPRGGRPLDTPLDLTGVSRETGWEVGFVVVFKNDEARKTFDSSSGHQKVKGDTDKLLEKVFVLDFVDEEGLGW